MLALTPLAESAPYTWTAASGTDLLWVTPGNWSPSGPPGATDTALLGNTALTNNTGAAAADNILATSRVIQTLLYTNNTGFHNTLLNPSVMLTISNSAAGDSLFDGGGINVATTNSISGPGAALIVTNTSGNINIRHAGGGLNNQRATLDLSGLDTFSAYIARLLVAGDGGSATTNSRVTGTLLLAKTNVIVASSGTVPALSVGDNPSNGAGGNADPTLLTSVLYLGKTNSIFADTVTIGRQKSAGMLAFNPLFTNGAVPAVYIRGFTGSRVTDFSIGDHSALAQSSNQRSAGSVDITGGSVDALLDTVFVGRSNTGNNTGSDGRPSGMGTLAFSRGTIDVNTLELGYETTLTDTGVGSIGIVNVSGTASLVVNTNMELSRGSTSQSVPAQGTLNVSGGTVTVKGPLTSGGGTSTISYTGGTLNLTNTTSFAGTVAKPIGSFSIANSTLNLAVKTGVTPVVANSLTINANTTINLRALPVIGTYPAQFPLVQYTSSGGDLNTLVLGSLPTVGAVPYQGYLSNNTANSTVDIVITNGFIATGVDIWTGTNNANWDLTSPNWTLFGSPTLFINAALAQFDDSAQGATNINLVGSLVPNTVTVSNNVKSYTFGGSGSLNGTATLVKDGTGTLIFTNSGINTFNGGILISNGTVQFGNGSGFGNLPASPLTIVNNGTLVLNQGGNVTITNDITGAGKFTQAGGGVVSLSGASSYAGQTLVASGSLMVDGSIGGSSLTNAPGTTVGGIGSNQGSFQAAGVINPGDVGGIGTFSTANGLTMHPGASLTVDLNSADNTQGNGINDLLQVTGGLTVNNTTIAMNLKGGLPQLGMSYPVLTYSGNLTGSFNPVVKSHFAATVDTSIANQVNVTITGSTGATLKWKSTASGVWNVGGAANWFNFGTSTSDVFGQADSVLFDDSGAGVQTNITLAAGVAVYPSAITNISSVNNYTISGAGTISGPTVLVKGGSGTLTINTTNGFSGGTTILNGTLVTGSGTALGSNSDPIVTNIIANGATLDVNAQNQGLSTFVVSGAGVGGKGAIINGGAAQLNAFRNIVLAGDTTFGGPGDASAGGNTLGRWDMRGGTPTLTCLDGNAYNLTKVGSNQVTFVGVTVDPNLANITLKGGVLGVQGAVSSLGNPTNTLTLFPGTLLHCAGFAIALNKVIVMTNATVDSTGAGANQFDGPVTFQGTNTFSLANPLTFTGGFNGAGGFVKTGAAAMSLTGSNSYTGDTTISAGIVFLTEPSDISGSANISVGLGATLDVNSRADQTLTVLSGHTFGGRGNLNGSLTNRPGASFFVGGNRAIGTNVISNVTALQGTTYMEITNIGARYDVLQAGGVVFGGTLVVSNLDNAHPLAAGQSFQLFSAGSYDGAFVNIIPAAPGAGLAWDTNSLTSSGTLSITSVPWPIITSVSLSGTNLVISGTNGAMNGTYAILTSTNLLLPLSQWTTNASSQFDGSGNFAFTNGISPNTPQQFYLLKTP